MAGELEYHRSVCVPTVLQIQNWNCQKSPQPGKISTNFVFLPGYSSSASRYSSDYLAWFRIAIYYLMNGGLTLLEMNDCASRMVETPLVAPRSQKCKDSESVPNRSSMIEARKSVHLDGSELEVVPDLTNFRPVTLTVSSFFKQVLKSSQQLMSKSTLFIHGGPFINMAGTQRGWPTS